MTVVAGAGRVAVAADSPMIIVSPGFSMAAGQTIECLGPIGVAYGAADIVPPCQRECVHKRCPLEGRRVVAVLTGMWEGHRYMIGCGLKILLVAVVAAADSATGKRGVIERRGIPRRVGVVAAFTRVRIISGHVIGGRREIRLMTRVALPISSAGQGGMLKCCASE